ncbi:MAG: hypothetical protein FJY73_00685 [Candidatus Eisenbacteria bacterium]|nr:hypothetical protein [Candidatus Eisenbacteria bacterium]
MVLRKTNLTTLFVWGLWWPGMIAAALAFGRVWCTVCPMELANRAGDALARLGGWPRARLGKILRAGWLVVFIYLVLQFLVAGASLHRNPHLTAVMLLALLWLALAAGVFFRERRSFCRAFCPAAALLSAYGRYTPVQLEARDPSVCEACETKECVREANRDRFDKRSCPSLLVPYRRAASDGCVLCLQCAKVCPHGNMDFGPTAADAPVRRKALLLPYEAAFVLVAFGFVAHEVIGEVKHLDRIFHAVPLRLNALSPGVPFGWFEAVWFLAIFPLAAWAVVAGAAFVAGHRGGLKNLLLAAATGAAPIVAVAHLGKAAAKVSSWSGFLPLAMRDPRGTETLARLAGGGLPAPKSFVELSVLGWAMIALVFFAGWIAARWSRGLPADSFVAARAGLGISFLLFAAVFAVWIR